MQRRETLGWAILLSLALHLTVFLSLLLIPPTQPPTSASDPLAVDLVVGDGPAEATSEPPASTQATAAPIEQAEIPPPTPAPAPDVPPPPPDQQAEIPPPTPAPNVLPPPKPVAQVQPPRAPPQRAAARAPVIPAGASAQATDGQNAASRAGGANNGAAWMG